MARRPTGDPIIHGPDEFIAAFGVSRETCQRLVCYADRLLHWQKAVNLVAPGTVAEVWHRHFADSAQLLALAPDAENWVDLGTGGGFPGMVIAILLANRPGSSVHLIESNLRKCAFLADVARETGIEVTIHQARIDAAASGLKGTAFDVVTARALAPLPRLLSLAAPFFAPETKGLFLKGKHVDTEIEEAGRIYAFQYRLRRSRTDSAGRIVEIEGLSRKDRG